MDVDDDARAIGRRLRRIRKIRRKSLEVLAGLSGLSTATLSRIENGLRALDSRSEIAALADALQVAPSELLGTRAELTPGSANKDKDGAVEVVHHALTAVELGHLNGGRVCSVDVLRDRIAYVQQARRRGRFAAVGVRLPALITDLHTSIAAGRDVGELLPLAALLHVDTVAHWLHDAGAPELRLQAAVLARDAAGEHGDTATLAVAAWGTSVALLTGGKLDLAQAELDSVTLPATTSATAGVLCGLYMTWALVAAVDRRSGEVHAPMDAASELAQRFGGGDDRLGYVVGPAEVGMRRMKLALEAGEPDRAVIIGAGIRPQEISIVARKAGYWMDYGQALAWMRGRYDDAVRALRTAERLFPERVRRNPFVRGALAELLPRSRPDAVGMELRGMAYRAGLPV
ncbi:MAG: helix-turn-helix domain-containing protein [Pseudonocardiaceae bacterium]